MGPGCVAGGGPMVVGIIRFSRLFCQPATFVGHPPLEREVGLTR